MWKSIQLRRDLSKMHQEHNIPWNLLASNFTYVEQEKRFTPRRTGYIFIKSPTQWTKDLDHFSRRMISVIQEFSTTERAKYPSSAELILLADDMLFSDQLRDKYPDYLDSDNQRLSFWIRSATYDFLTYPNYNTFHGGLADVVKILIHENQMGTLLMLANHPLVPLHRLAHLSYGYHFGFIRIIEAALTSYVFWNFMAASGRLASGEYRNKVFGKVVNSLTVDMDHAAQQIPHQEFYGIKNHVGREGPMPEIDHVKLRDHLKHLFELLYRYDMMMVECGADRRWTSEISGAITSFTKMFWYDAPGV